MSSVIFLVVMGILLVGFLALVGVLIGVLVSSLRERRDWRGPGLSADEHVRPLAELQDPAGAGPAPAESGALAAWNMAQFQNQQAGSGTALGPF